MIAILKYNAGNILSVQHALNRLGVDSIITDEKSIIKSADKVIFPGVGEASSAMDYIREKQLDELICSLSKPFLGICLGLQLMCKRTAENNTIGLGIFDSEVKLFPPKENVPHVGWNEFESIGGKLLTGVKKKDDVYYVHSYYAEISPHTVAKCNYILPFSASLEKDNFFATQFHPEKSAAVGQQILKNFIEL